MQKESSLWCLPVGWMLTLCSTRAQKAVGDLCVRPARRRARVLKHLEAQLQKREHLQHARVALDLTAIGATVVLMMIVMLVRGR